MTETNNQNVPAGDSFSIEALREVFRQEPAEVEFTDSDEAVATSQASESEKAQLQTSEEVEDEQEEAEATAEGEVDDEQQLAPDDEESDADESSQEADESTPRGNWKERSLTFKVGDEEVELSNNSILTIPVNGEDVEMPLQEIINRASGDKSVEQRITEVETERKTKQAYYAELEQKYSEREAEVEKANNTIKTISELATTQKPIDVLYFAAKQAGKNPVDVIKNTVDTWISLGSQFSSMTPEQRQAWEQKLEISVAKKQLEEQKQELESQSLTAQEAAELQALEQVVHQKLVETDTTEEEFDAAAAQREAHGVEYQTTTALERVDEVLATVHENRVVAAAEAAGLGVEENFDLLTQIYQHTWVAGVRKTGDIQRVVNQLAQEQQEKEKAQIAGNLSEKVLNSSSKKAKKASAKKKVEDAPLRTLRSMETRHVEPLVVELK